MSTSATPIRFNFLIPFSLKERNKLKEFLRQLFKKEGKTLAQLDYIFCDDEYLLKINQDFLHHDTYTDIITFDLSEKKMDPITGEIYISVDRVKENAGQFKIPVSIEMTRVIFHGALHLCGYKDKTTREQSLMRSKEDYYLKLFHVKK